jgi:hypothetical protein
MFKWLQKKNQKQGSTKDYIHMQGDHAVLVDSVKVSESAGKANEAIPIPLGCWVWMELPGKQERLLGFVYLDSTAGLSVQGGLESAENVEELAGYIVRLRMPLPPIRQLTFEEISNRGLPPTPSWLEHYGPQPDPGAAWHSDPHLKGLLHASFPDDIQVLVHDGEPRRTKREPELCWVRILTTEQGPTRRYIFIQQATTLTKSEFDRKYEPNDVVYVAKLLNTPHKLKTVCQGDTIRFLAGGGLQHPLHVSTQYLQERVRWFIAPCDKCGMGECLDPPSTMIELRFKTLSDPEIKMAEPFSFSSFCPRCGGHQFLSRDEKEVSL